MNCLEKSSEFRGRVEQYSYGRRTTRKTLSGNSQKRNLCFSRCLSVCLSVCPIENQELLEFQIFIGKLGRTTGMFLAWFKGDAFSRLTFTRKIWCPVKAGFLSYSLIYNMKIVIYNFLNIFLG